jgi:hypothetical protein
MINASSFRWQHSKKGKNDLGKGKKTAWREREMGLKERERERESGGAPG